MKYKLSHLLRFISGFIFCFLFFVFVIKLYIGQGYFIYFLISFIMSIIYLYSSFLVVNFKMHYFFEFKKEMFKKILLIVLMYISAFVLGTTFEIIVESRKTNFLGLYFLVFYLAFDLLSEMAISATSYGKSINYMAYESAEILIVKYLSQNKIKRKETSEKSSQRKGFRFGPFAPKENCFMGHHERCYAFCEKDFKEKLLEFSRENQLFYKKVITDENYILDTRCNEVCISTGVFSLYDHCGKKCIFTYGEWEIEES